MSEMENRSVSSSDTIDEGDQDAEENARRIFEELRDYVEKMSSSNVERTMGPGLTFQRLRDEFQQVSKSDDNYQDRVHRLVQLSIQLIDNIEEATNSDIDCLQDCLQGIIDVLVDPEFNSLLKNDESFARELFFALIDALAKPQICRYLRDDQQMMILHKSIYKSLTDLLVAEASMTIPFVLFTSDDLTKYDYKEIISAMYTSAEREVRSEAQNRSRISSDDQNNNFILSFFWNLSDRTVIVPWLLGIGFIKSMLEWLKIPELSSDTFHKIISVIHNVSRHDDGTDELKEFDGLQIIKQFQSSDVVKSNAEINLLASMAIALLSTPEQIRSDNKRMNSMLNQLLQMTIDAAQADRYRHDGFHVSEPLAVLTKLLVDDHSLEYVLSHAETNPAMTVSSTIALFVDLLDKFCDALAGEDRLKQFTCTALLNILWSISFHDRYKTKMKQDKDLLRTVRNLVNDDSGKLVDQYVPRHMESIRKAAEGILYNLHEEVPVVNEVAINTIKTQISAVNSEKPMIMISYSHSNNPFCDKILSELEKNRNQYEIWIDRNHCTSSADLWTKIARGIKQSHVVLCLLSDNYYSSKSCRKEVTFAIDRGKSIIPVYIEDPGECDWLDIHIVGLKYVRFKNTTNQLDINKVKELLATIRATIEETGSQPSHQQVEQHDVPTQPQETSEKVNSTKYDIEKPLEEWNSEDIHKWFIRHKVPGELVSLYDFQSVDEMQQYALKLRADSNKEYIKYRQRYAKLHNDDELEEYVYNRFVTALLSLPKSKSGTMETPIQATKTPTPKSSTCNII